MADLNDVKKSLATWARQTILYGIGIKAQDDGQPVDDPSQIVHAQNAMEKVVSELWAETAKECPQTVVFVMKFARRVLDWVEDHRHGNAL